MYGSPMVVSIWHCATPYTTLTCIVGQLVNIIPPLLRKIMAQKSRAPVPQDSYCMIDYKAHELRRLFAQKYSIHSSTDLPSELMCILRVVTRVMDTSDFDVKLFLQCIDSMISILQASPHRFWYFQRTYPFYKVQMNNAAEIVNVLDSESFILIPRWTLSTHLCMTTPSSQD